MIKKYKISKLFLLIFSIGLQDAYASDVTVAAGVRNISPNDLNSAPVILVTNDAWKTWKYPEVPNIAYTSLYSITCPSVNCVAVGRNQGLGAEIRISDNNGMTWMIPNSPFNVPSLFGVKCSNNICVAVGGVDNHSPGNNILRSQNTGKTWETSKLNFNANIANLVLKATAHQDQQWLAIGKSTTTDYQSAAGIAISEDNGKTWNWITSFNDMRADTLNGLTCNDKICVAAGSSAPKQFPSYATLVIKNSQDSNWSFLLPLQNNYYYSTLDDVTCSQEVCMAVGEILRGQNTATEGVVLISDAEGKNWNPQLPFSNISSIGYSHLSSVYCEDQTCVMAGFFQQTMDAHLLGMLFTSHDKGEHWSSYIVKSPLKGYDVYLDKIKIDGKVITALGRVANGSESYSPIIVASNDRGDTWKEYMPFENYGLRYSQLFDVTGK